MEKKGKLGSMIKAGEKPKAVDASENGISENGVHPKEEQENGHSGDSGEAESSPEEVEEQKEQAPATPKKKKTEETKVDKPVKSGSSSNQKKQHPKLSLKAKKSENEDGDDEEDDEIKTSFKDMRYYDDEGKPIPRELQMYFGGTREQMDREYCDGIFPDSNIGKLIKSILYQVIADDPERFKDLHAGLKPEVDEDGDVIDVGETIKITNEAYTLLHSAAEDHLRRVCKVADAIRQSSSVIGLNLPHLRVAANIDLLEKNPDGRFNFKDPKKGFLIAPKKRRTLDLKAKQKRFAEMNSMPLKDYLLKHKAPEAMMTEEEIFEKEKDTYITHTLKRLESPLGSSIWCKTFVYDEPAEESVESEESDSEDQQHEQTQTKPKPKKTNNTNVKKEPTMDKKSVTFKKVKKEKAVNEEEEEEGEEEEEETPAPPKKKAQAKPKPAQKRKASEIEEDEEDEVKEKAKPQKKKAKSK